MGSPRRQDRRSPSRDQDRERSKRGEKSSKPSNKGRQKPKGYDDSADRQSGKPSISQVTNLTSAPPSPSERPHSPRGRDAEHLSSPTILPSDHGSPAARAQAVTPQRSQVLTSPFHSPSVNKHLDLSQGTQTTPQALVNQHANQTSLPTVSPDMIQAIHALLALYAAQNKAHAGPSTMPTSPQPSTSTGFPTAASQTWGGG